MRIVHFICSRINDMPWQQLRVCENYGESFLSSVPFLSLQMV